jgi:hypothetical protein
VKHEGGAYHVRARLELKKKGRVWVGAEGKEAWGWGMIRARLHQVTNL